MFSQFDILFIKDIKFGVWYMPIMDECNTLIHSIIAKKGYSHVFAVTSSSGAIPLLNITPNIPSFRQGIMINGRTTIKESIIEKYKHTKDYIPVDPVADILYCSPLERLNYDQLSKYVYYFNHNLSDY
jgi:hypothetical protein